MSLFNPNNPANQRLRDNVAPEGWINPEPADQYNLVVIGAGPCGLIAAAGAAGLGAKVALIERHAMGGDCLNVGCIPTKALISAARAAYQVSRAAPLGVSTSEPDIDFETVMNRMRTVRADISHIDSTKRYQDELGVDVFLGQAAFSSPSSIEVDGRSINFNKALIATGARATKPNIPGLWETGADTNETIFSLTKLPEHLAVIGAGPIGCELAQTFVRLGSKVTLIDNARRLLPREDPDASALVEASFKSDGIQILTKTKIQKVTGNTTNKTLHYQSEGESKQLSADTILVATGRQPNIENLNLPAAGIDSDRKGIRVNDNLRTSNKHVFAAGDVVMEQQFTHAADAAARIVIQNALFLGRKKVSDLVIPRCTYTQPEVAQVGLSEGEATDNNTPVDIYLQHFDHIDRAILESQTEGFVKVLTRKRSAEILGATIVGDHAGEMISELTLAMTHGIGLDQIATTIHPYPTRSDAIKKVADAYSRTKLTPKVAHWMKKWLSWLRQ